MNKFEATPEWIYAFKSPTSHPNEEDYPTKKYKWNGTKPHDLYCEVKLKGIRPTEIWVC